MFDVSIVIGFGNNTAISTSKTMNITAIRKNRDENDNRADFFGSNPLTEHKRSKFFCVNVGCVLLYLLHLFIQQRHFENVSYPVLNVLYVYKKLQYKIHIFHTNCTHAVCIFSQ